MAVLVAFLNMKEAALIVTEGIGKNYLDVSTMLAISNSIHFGSDLPCARSEIEPWHCVHAVMPCGHGNVTRRDMRMHVVIQYGIVHEPIVSVYLCIIRSLHSA